MRCFWAPVVFAYLPSAAFSSCADNLEVCLSPEPDGYWLYDETKSASILGEEMNLPLACLQNGLRFESAGELSIVPTNTRNYQRCKVAIGEERIFWKLVYSEVRFQWRILLWTGEYKNPKTERFLAPRFPQGGNSILLLSSDLLDARTGIRYLSYAWKQESP